ncbi:uncharacterized protein [Musca autumnalis]|uniref:uncharacterized protein n=1 Tax=Musca autumnalis TaxID=221902 RepID=UPI003CFB8AD3
MEDFLLQCDEITSFEEDLVASDASIYNEAAAEAEKVELQRIWSEWRHAYKKCTEDPECAKKNKEVLKTKKKAAHQSYIKCTSILGERMEKVKVVPSAVNHRPSSSVMVPPCDTEVFEGDYLSWPSFRDLFTAIYANNKKLSPVEKLFHLFQKTSGEAREINRHIPLTAEGFTIAWDNLRNQASECQAQGCPRCKARHHVLLHKEKRSQNSGSNISGSPNLSQVCASGSNVASGPTTSTNGRDFHTSVSKRTMLATAWIDVLKDGASYRVRALVDPCSDDTFVSSRVQKRLKLPTTSVSADISGLGGEHLTKCSKVASITIGSRKNSSFALDLEAFVVPEITGNIPTQPLEEISLDQLPELDLADPTFYESAPVDVLLGGNVYPIILLNGVRKDIFGSLLAQETVFGWILTGPTTNLVDRQGVRVSYCSRVEVKDELTRFWEIEEVPRVPVVSAEDCRCEEIFQSTTIRGPDGRYVVDLPFRAELPFSVSSKASRYVALSQFLRNELSLARNPERKGNYDEVVLEYLALGHMEKVQGLVDYQDCYYLPHHGIFKPESATTKLRVVFNASCPSVEGRSLNDALYVGPTLQKDIVSLVLNWRIYKYVFNADITKMYRQIWVNPEHRKYQRILFRPTPEDEIADYQLKTVTFGVNCALRTLLKLADDEEYRFPVGSKILRDNMYVDDALLVDTVVPQLDLPKATLTAWSDSTIVLSWLKKPSYSWTTFVANRVAVIQEKIGNDWRHVPTNDNPADLATRGRTPSELKESFLWWHGPGWLTLDKNKWPTCMSVPETTLEAKPAKVHLAQSAVPDEVLERFSRLSTAIHAVAYLFRFLRRTHPSTKKLARFDTVRLSAEEIAFARSRLMSKSQRIHFPQEYDCLSKKLPLDSGSPLLSLNPFLDRHQLIRANGRLGNTLYLPYDERHPIILAYSSRFAELYVDHIHLLTNHGGIQLTLATTRLECWIIRGKNLVKNRYRKCVKCVMAQKKRQAQLMAALPPERTTFSRPFATSGVDFAGPFEIKTFNGHGCRLSKGYICLFVCFVTKAIHLEPVSELSTPAFLAALSRFVSRRGCPLHIYSDNGKNFVGADREIRANFGKVVSELKDEAVVKYGFQKLDWHFILAAAPHMGGLWEAGVKSCKTHLKKMSGQVRHTFEEFATILARIESCLNSRPLSPLSHNVDDLGALTPGHFLIGGPLLVPTEPEQTEKTSLQNRWRRLQLLTQEFCGRWKSEYLKELHKRTKWKRSQSDLQLDDLVVLHTDSMASNEWRLGRVIKLYRGPDGRVRMAYNEEYLCPFCHARHGLRKCRTFLQMTPDQKAVCVTVQQYCANCLGMSHQATDCPLLEGCRKCRQHHHTMLHAIKEDTHAWMKMTAEMLVHIPGILDVPTKVRAYKNPVRTRSSIRFGGPLPEYRPEFGASVRVVMTSVRNRVFTYTATLRTDRRAPSTIPRRSLDLRCLKGLYPKAEVADQSLFRPGPIHIILGNDAAEGIFMGLPIFRPDLPHAQKTIFGWAFFGEVPLKRT